MFNFIDKKDKPANACLKFYKPYITECRKKYNNDECDRLSDIYTRMCELASGNDLETDDKYFNCKLKEKDRTKILDCCKKTSDPEYCELRDFFEFEKIKIERSNRFLYILGIICVVIVLYIARKRY